MSFLNVSAVTIAARFCCLFLVNCQRRIVSLIFFSHFIKNKSQVCVHLLFYESNVIQALEIPLQMNTYNKNMFIKEIVMKVESARGKRIGAADGACGDGGADGVRRVERCSER